ncbi:MAG: hypothetical protein EOO07_03355 [Chitinophagaceae bacterium]|nr:MAG: hypothetical protein EOO07_03355 [Chitinophagaceae bacterium]
MKIPPKRACKYRALLQVSTVLLTALISCGFAYADTVGARPEITEDSVNLPADVFLKEFVSQTPHSRSIARLYMLGVMDSTEGKVWCDYKTLSTAALNEFVFEYMKKLKPEQLNRRAAFVIEDALRTNFPCKAK